VRIDVHAHYFPVEYLDRLDRYAGTKATQFFRKRSSPPKVQRHRKRISATWNLRKWTCKSSPSQPASVFRERNDAVDAARLGNDFYTTHRQEYPKRFAAFCLHAPSARKASIAEMTARARRTRHGRRHCRHRRPRKKHRRSSFDGFFGELNRRKAVLFIHPIGGSAGSPLIESAKLTWPIGAPLEEHDLHAAIHASEYSQPISRHKIILPHLGGFAPFLTAASTNCKIIFCRSLPRRPASKQNISGMTL